MNLQDDVEQVQKYQTDEKTFMEGEVNQEKESEEGKVGGEMNLRERARYQNK